MIYLNVTENGSGRIILKDTPKEIAGLVIKKLYTCTAIVIIGKQKISVIHDESYLKIEDIKKEFTFVEDIKNWSIYYNPHSLNGEGLKQREIDMQSLIMEYGKQYQKGSGTLFCEAPRGELLVDRATKKIELTVSTNLKIIEPKDIKQRIATRHLSNRYADHLQKIKGTYRLVPIDTQYDGSQLTSPDSSFISDINQVGRIVLDMFTSGDNKALYDEHLHYCQLFPNFSMPKYQSPCSIFREQEKKYGGSEDPETLQKLIQFAKSVQEECSGSMDFDSISYFEGIQKFYSDKMNSIIKDMIGNEDCKDDPPHNNNTTASTAQGIYNLAPVINNMPSVAKAHNTVYKMGGCTF